jgi:hypothetical protein
MPVFMVQLIYEFAAGHVNGSTEEAPAYLLGEDGRLVKPLASWPKAPLEIEATDEGAAVDRAQRQQSEAGVIYIDNRIGEVRFQALKRRPQPGSNGKNSSVLEIWSVQRKGEEDRHAHIVPLGPPSAS